MAPDAEYIQQPKDYHDHHHDIEDIFDLEAEIEYLRLVIRKISKNCPEARISKKTASRLRMKAIARIEFRHGLHKQEPQH